MASSSKPNLDGILLLEQPFARLPHESLRRQLRTHQRLVDRDMAYCASLLSDIGASTGPSSAARTSGASSSKSPQKSSGSKSKTASSTPASKLAIAEAALAKRRAALTLAGSSSNAGSSSSLSIPSPGASAAVNAGSGAATPSSASGSSQSQAPPLSSAALSADAVSVDDSLLLATHQPQPSAATAVPNKPDSEVHRALDVMIGRLRGLKRKVSSEHCPSRKASLIPRSTHLRPLPFKALSNRRAGNVGARSGRCAVEPFGGSPRD